MKKSILLVDDEIINHVMNKHLLEQCLLVGDVNSARDGKEAIELLEGKVAKNEPLPDIIFLDINMPGMNGFQFIEEITSRYSLICSKLTIAILSSSLDDLDLLRVKELGVKYFIEKPLDLPTIELILSHD